MSEFTPGDVWRRETEDDTEILVLRSQPAAGTWLCGAVTVGKGAGYIVTRTEVRITEVDLIEEWTPLIPDPEFHLRRVVRAGARVLAQFTEECDPWMTPRGGRDA